jgi:hypothetical protein
MNQQLEERENIIIKMDYQAIAKQFLDQYYSTMSSNRMNLLNFYTDKSCMTYEGDSYKGINKIKDKLESMGSSTIKYQFDEYDLQPGAVDGSMLIVVIGGMKVDEDQPFPVLPDLPASSQWKGWILPPQRCDETHLPSKLNNWSIQDPVFSP